MSYANNNEEKYALFSPLGMTDPITKNHDGAMLHITRKYRPAYIYLFMSGEVSELDENDDRYKQALIRLGESIGMHFSIYKIKHPELSEVHLFDEFYDEFEECIRRIKEENPGVKILLNVSSGTPAMKSALHTIAAMSEDGACIPVQVSTPEKKHKRGDYDLCKEWECNVDNDTADFTDRTALSKNRNLVLKLKKEIICKHIDAFDYHAALAVAEDSVGMPEDAVRLLRAATARVQLDRSGVDRERTKDERSIFAPVSDSEVSGIDARGIAEHIMLLDIELKRHEYRSFILGVSPVFSDLLQILLKNNGIDMAYYCAGRILKRSKLEGSDQGREILDVFKKVGHEICRDSILGSAQLVTLIRSDLINLDKDTKKTVDNLRRCERVCRNLAAHEIISVTKTSIKNKCGATPEEILGFLVSLAGSAGIPKDKLDRSYEKVNELIKEALGKGV